MQSKSILLGFAAAAASSMILGISAPAEAISIGSSYTISGRAFFPDPGTKIDFINPGGAGPDPGRATVISATGDFSSIDPIELSSEISINLAGKALDIASLGNTPYKLIDFKSAPPLFPIPEDDFDFTVTSGVVTANKRFLFEGRFGDGTLGRGEIAQLLSEKGKDGSFGFSGTFTAVPTPALLPGLIGMGVAALRKKQGGEAEQEA